MSVTLEAIMDAAELRIRQAGYNGFSFREVAADVGIKSSSVHHHFPAKADLAAAVARRYADRFYSKLEAGPAEGQTAAICQAFRDAIHRDGRMCLCGVLGAEAGGLPEEVVVEARRFFERGLRLLEAERLSLGAAAARAGDDAYRIMATLEGAMLLARVFQSAEAFDRATHALIAG